MNIFDIVNNYTILKMIILSIAFIFFCISAIIIAKKQYKLAGLSLVLTFIAFGFMCFTIIQIK